MTFKKCKVCGEQVIVWDLDEHGECRDKCLASYSKHVGIRLHAPNATEEQKKRVIDAALDLCKSAGTAREAAARLRHMRLDKGPSHGRVDFGTLDDEPTVGAGVPSRSYTREVAEKAAQAVRVNGFHVEKSIGNYVGSLQEMIAEYGFTQPEDGSENRYDERRARQSSGRHAFWWWLHNCVAHPLIGVMPRRFAFEFHDWTSRKLHGR